MGLGIRGGGGAGALATGALVGGKESKGGGREVWQAAKSPASATESATRIREQARVNSLRSAPRAKSIRNFKMLEDFLRRFTRLAQVWRSHSLLPETCHARRHARCGRQTLRLQWNGDGK